MIFYIKAIAINPITKKEYNPCGTDYGTIFHDLKTVKGAYNRVKNNSWRKNVIRIDILQGYRLYDDNSFKKVFSFIPEKHMTF